VKRGFGNELITNSIYNILIKDGWGLGFGVWGLGFG